MRNSSREIPQVSFVDICYEAFAVGINRGNSSTSMEHECPFCSRVPVQFANTTGGKSHIHARDRLGHRQFAYRYFTADTKQVAGT